MSEKIYVQLGKSGDIMSLLPILYQDSLEGQKPSLMVAEKYASILDGVSYVNPVVFKGEISQLDAAMAEAKKTGLEVICTQIVGIPEQVQEHVYKRLDPPNPVTDSWQKEQYRAAGKWGLWGTQPPLVFDRRDKERELATALHFNLTGNVRQRGVILVSTEGETCPFPQKRLLMALLDGEFKRHFRIIDLDGFRAERIYDMLAVFDQAKLLIAADSALLHLAHASKIPVCALVNDRPDLSRGAAWRPNHLFFCRYRDFGERSMDLIDAIKWRGTPGCRLHADRAAMAWIHVWSGYDVTSENRKRHQRALETWNKVYHFRNWISLQAEVGSCGRDSKHGPLKDKSRFPYVRDVIRMAEMMGKESDVIVLTPADVCFNVNPETITNLPAFGSRTERSKDGDTHNPRTDFFAFTKKWWMENRKNYPDMIMGPDGYWSRTLRELMRMRGGTEVFDITYRETEE